MIIAVKSLACEMPYQHELPLSRLSISDIRREAIRRGLVASVGSTTIWRWLTEDAIRPWAHRTWIFPRDPLFEEKAGRVLDLYAGTWNGRKLGENDFVISADEKTSIQARQRINPSRPPGSGRPMLVEHEYKRLGAWAYMAAWDVRRAKVFGLCEQSNGIDAFDRLVKQVMSREPYRSARRVYWIVDNGSSHRGQQCVDRIRAKWPTITLVHTPVHASWLNQVEIYFSVVQRKVLTPNDFSSIEDLENRLLQFQRYYEQAASPFEWKYTRSDLAKLLSKLKVAENAKAYAA
jgi:hypothetical protein